MVALSVRAVLCKNDEVLLLRHVKNAPFGGGLYSLVGGKVQSGETALQAIKRKVHEEVGLEISEKMFTLVHVFHRKSYDSEWLVLCFKTDIYWQSQPINCQPQKNDDMRWRSIHELP